MTAQEYRGALSRLGLSQAQAARLIGVNTRTSERWGAGDRDVPPPVQRLVWLLEHLVGVDAQLALFEAAQ